MYEIHQKLMKKRELKQKEKESSLATDLLSGVVALTAAAVVPQARAATTQSSFMNDTIIKKSQIELAKEKQSAYERPV